MSADPSPTFRMGPTRPRDLFAVALVAAIAGYVLVRLDYARIPPLPRFAGIAAAVLGIAEGIFGYGLRSRIQADAQKDRRPTKPPVPPLTAARAARWATFATLDVACDCRLLAALISSLRDSFRIG